MFLEVKFDSRAMDAVCVGIDHSHLSLNYYVDGQLGVAGRCNLVDVVSGEALDCLGISIDAIGECLVR